MKSLNFDELDAVSGGVSIHALGVPTTGAGDANVPYLNGAGTSTGLNVGNLGNLLGGAGGLGSLGGALGNIGPIVSELIHSPAVSGIVQAIEQIDPAIGTVVNGVVHMIDGQGGAQGLNLGSLLGGLGGSGGTTGQGGPTGFGF